MRKHSTRVLRGAVVTVAAALALGACATEGATTSGGGGGAGADGPAPVQVGVVSATSGPLAAYGKQFVQGFKAGIDYATDGTGKVDGHPLEITYHDGAADPAKATNIATGLIGEGYEIITGSVSSGVAVQMAPLAEQNDVLFISGPAATDQITGINEHTFRAGRQTYQDVVTAGQIVGDVQGKKVVVFAQDYEFGQANVKAVTQVLGKQGGAEVVPVLAPVDATDFTPFARKILDQDPDLVFVAWAGDTASTMWRTLAQQGVLEKTTVVTGLATRASYGLFGPATSKIQFLSHYFAGASDTEANQALKSWLQEKGLKADLFHNDGFVAAQMVVRAVQQGGTDVSAMIEALEGWSFTGPKGQMTIRAEDHAMLQPMFQARLVRKNGTVVPELVETYAPEAVAPPVAG